MGKYINPFTDFGFKKLFGEDDTKAYLIDFLNSVLPEYHHVRELEFNKNEYLSQNQDDRKSIIDISCMTIDNQRIIIELQREPQNYFLDRSVYYFTFPIVQQARKGDWSYKLDPVYVINILNFTINDNNYHDVVRTIELKDNRNEVFYKKAALIYLMMPNFNKTADELQTNQDKWLYIFKNLAKFDDIPEVLQKDQKFEHLFEKAVVATLNKDEFNAYESGLKIIRDNFNVLEAKFEKGKIEGRVEGIKIGEEKGIKIGEEKGKIEIARSMKQEKLPIDLIVKVTGLNKQVIEDL